MSTLLVGLLYSYFLGGIVEIGPFTDLKSCENARAFQLQWGIKEVSLCRPVFRVPEDEEKPLRGTATPFI